MIKGIQIIGLLVGFYLLARTIVDYRKGNYGIKKTVFWLALWILIIVLFIHPPLAQLALPVLMTQDIIMSVLVIGLVTAFVAVFEVYHQVTEISRKFTELVQNIAIHDYMKEAIENTLKSCREENE
jgi:hypothetical protein